MAEKRSTRMQLILQLAERDEQVAVDALHENRQKLGDVEEQLIQIRDYQREYLLRVNGKVSGLSAREMISDRQLIHQLSVAEDAQLIKFIQSKKYVDMAMKYWQKLHQRRKNIEELIGKMRNSENQLEEKMLQKELDELASQNFARDSGQK
jgi:flagellar FliJ protein